MSLSSQSPTRVRYGVLGFACALSMITYLDRVCMGTVIGNIKSDFGFDDFKRGLIFGAFGLAYAMFEVPTGWLGDRFGPKKTLIRVVLWWSVFTALTGLIYPSFWGAATATVLLICVRFLFGAGEAGAYPNIARAFHNWFPYEERGWAKGSVWMAGRLAGGVTALIVMTLLFEYRDADNNPHVAWRHTFWIFGGIGVVWCVCFAWWFQDRPEQMPAVNSAELALIHDGETSHDDKPQVPWRRLLSSGNLWALCLMYFCGSYGWYFNITYLPAFLREQFGVDKEHEFWTFSILAGLPLLFGSVACLTGGWLTDLFIKRTGDRKWGRRLFGMVGHGMCACCYFGGIAFLGFHSPWPFVLAIALAAFWNDMTMGATWASCLDIGGRYSGVVSGCMNTIGNLGGAVAGVLTGTVLEHSSQFGSRQGAWTLNFLTYGSVYIIAVLLWLYFDATKRLDRAPQAVPVDEPLPVTAAIAADGATA